MKPRLLILDADAVIHLCEIGKWDALLEAYEVVLSETVAMKECRYYEDDSGYRIEISIREDIDSGRIRMEREPVESVICTGDTAAVKAL